MHRNAVGALAVAVMMTATGHAQTPLFPVQPITDRSVLCSMTTSVGPCVVVARARVGAFAVEVLRPREHGTYLGDRTMKWHLYVESSAGRWGTLRPIHDEATVCTGEGTERVGGYDALEVESLRAVDLAGDRRPELVVEWRTERRFPPLVMICALDPGGPRCTYPQASGRLARDAGGIRIGGRVIAPP